MKSGRASRGAVWVGIGDRAHALAVRGYTRFRQLNPDTPGLIVTECARARGVEYEVVVDDLAGATDAARARNAKVRLPEFAPWDQVLYLDADTLVNGDLSPCWAALDTGWELVIAPSTNQDRGAFWHVDPAEAAETMEQLHSMPLQLQGGMFLYHRTAAILDLFDAWREEWGKRMGEDQAALVRALHRCPIRTWLLGRPFNGGAVVAHRFGEILRND